MYLIVEQNRSDEAYDIQIHHGFYKKESDRINVERLKEQ